MFWLSYQERFYSALPPAEVLSRVQASLLPAGELTWRDSYRPAAGHLFRGSVTGNTFEVLRYDHQVRISRPVGPFPVRGEVWATATGSCVSLRISLSQEAALSSRVALGLAVILILVAGITSWLHSHAFLPFWNVLLPVGVLTAFWLFLLYLNLHQEAAKSRPLLVALLQLHAPPRP